MIFATASFAATLYETPVSQGIRAVSWIIPFVQSVHIVAIAVLIGAALVMELRFLNLFAQDTAATAVARRHLPWLFWALAALLTTGLIMVVGEPDRTLNNYLFWYKMALVGAAFLLTFALRRPLLRDGFDLDQAKWAGLVKPSALLLLMIWVAIIFCGRWIAYVV